MAKTRIYEEYMQATHDEDLVVFLIGARVRRWWKISSWLPVARAMPRMLRELEENPEYGFLGGETWGGRTSIMVQYWKSRDHLLRYARDRNAQHLPAWKEFNRRVGNNGDVGIWHETYEVPRAGIESLYCNMPPFGLGKVAGLEKARGRKKGKKGEPNSETEHRAARSAAA